VIKVLVVDDSALMRRVLTDIFRAEGDIEVAFARDGVEALQRLRDFQPDVVTLDVNMPQMDGLQCLDRIMLEHPCPVVMVSSLTEAGADVTLEALELGAVDFLVKPAGAVSLAIDELGPALIEKVRAAARARLPGTLRLTERVRLRASGAAPDAVRRRRLALPTGIATKRSVPEPSSAGPRAGPAGATDLVVLIGTSTGGPPALDRVLAPLPADFPWPIVVAQHMPAAFTGPLARRLDKLCALTVMEVTRPTPLAPGFVYIGKGEADIIVSLRAEGPMVLAAPLLPEHRWHPSVDRLVTTAIDQLSAARLIGVLMTGMGNDGAAAMTRLRQEGGRTVAEAEETAVVWGMPGELVRMGGAEVVAPVQDIAGLLLRWAG
jgi:two-component system chemotaxis response regulator CheB